MFKNAGSARFGRWFSSSGTSAHRYNPENVQARLGFRCKIALNHFICFQSFDLRICS